MLYHHFIYTFFFFFFLQELHVENQNLGSRQNLIFDPRTCIGLSKTLKVLNTSKNKMLDLSPLHELKSIHTLNTADNDLRDLDSAIEILSVMQNLKILDLKGNPLTKKLRYRETVIGSCPRLEHVDGKNVDDSSRTMMKNLNKARKFHRESGSIRNECSPSPWKNSSLEALSSSSTSGSAPSA